VPIGGRVVDVLPILLGQRRPALVDHTGEDGKTAESGAQETARGWTFRDAIHPDDLDPFVKNWTELSAIGALVEAEARFRRFDGEYRWFLIRALPVRLGKICAAKQMS
jgi:PAS domain-containing protein